MKTTPSKLIQATIDFVKKTLKDAEGGHDWFHIQRVWTNAKEIAALEDCDEEVVELAALLHDIADSKFHDGDETIGPVVTANFLMDHGVDGITISQVVKIMENMSYNTNLGSVTFDSIELRIVQDADRLDAIGAIGIARAFNYGGFKNRTLFNPEIQPSLNMSKEEYKKSTAPTINHFYEKLLLLKDLMRTEKGQQMAQERHDYMLGFLEQFYQEWGLEPRSHNN
jgi:uncharacterized protein